MHHLLTEAFGKAALQPFRIMVAPRRRNATLYAYSAIDGEALRQAAKETGPPEVSNICQLDELAVKTMPESWQVGRRLAFDVKARPVRRLQKQLNNFRKGAEVDVFLVETLHSKNQADATRPDRERVYAKWLVERFGEAARLERVRIARLESRRVKRRQPLKKPDVTLEGPDVTFHGELSILDGEAFATKLAKGIGRHCSYGYGMLLLRPASR